MAGPANLTERQQKWFASVRAGLERDTGKTMDEWVAIAKTCPETTPKAQQQWLKDHHGLLQNRAMQVIGEAFGSKASWNEPDKLRETLWVDPASTAILNAIEAVALTAPDVVAGQRKGYSAWSRKVQFAALKPVKGGKAMLGLAVSPDANARLEAPKNESWSERLKARLLLNSPAEVDGEIAALLKAAWENS